MQHQLVDFARRQMHRFTTSVPRDRRSATKKYRRDSRVSRPIPARPSGRRCAAGSRRPSSGAAATRRSARRSTRRSATAAMRARGRVAPARTGNHHRADHVESAHARREVSLRRRETQRIEQDRPAVVADGQPAGVLGELPAFARRPAARTTACRRESARPPRRDRRAVPGDSVEPAKQTTGSGQTIS